MSDDSARIEISANSSQLDSGLRDAASKISRWSMGISAGTARAMAGIAKPLATIGTGALHRVGAQATDFVTDQAKGTKEFEGNLVRLGIAGDLNRIQLDKMREAALKHSSAFGIAKGEIAKGTQAYVDLTGDIAGAAQSMEDFSKISAASGANVDDVSKAAAAYRGVGIELKDMPNIFSGLISQGKAGAVSLKDFAGELAGILPRWAKFKDATSMKGLGEMGAVFQVARQGFGSASEAATGMTALMGSFVQDAEKFAKAGVQMFDTNPKTGVKTLRSFEQIMQSIEKSKLVKDPTLMNKALGSKEAEQTITMLLKARKATEGQESAYRKLVAAGGDYAVLQKDLDTWLSSAPGKADVAWEGMKNKIAEAFTPDRIEAFADLLTRAVEKAGDLVDLIGEIKDLATGDADQDSNPFAIHAKDIGSSTIANLNILGGAGTSMDALERGTKAGLADEASKGKDASIDANRKAFDDEMARIKGAKSRSDKIRAAVAADVGGMYRGEDPNAPGALGRKLAGEQWLAKSGLSKGTIDAERNKLWEDVQKKQTADLLAGFKTLGAEIVGAINGKSITIDGNKVDSAIGKSTNAAARPR